MSYLVAALLLLTLIAAAVTITDAVRAPHWRVVAVERRRTWQERAGSSPSSPSSPSAPSAPRMTRTLVA